MKDAFEQMVREAGALALQTALKDGVHVKGRSDYVTDADLAISDTLAKGFAKLVPGSRMLSEEGETVKDLQGKLFIVDPVDGTTNLMYNMGLSAVSAAYLEEGKLRFGAIYNPFTQEMFSAEAGKGATLNGTAIHVNADPTLTDALFGVEAEPATAALQGDFFIKLFELHTRSRGIRWTGSAALDLAYVACGRLSGCVFHYLYPWDYAAGWLILQEAGGMLTSSHGLPPTLVGRSGLLAASNGHLHSELLRAFTL